MAIPTILAGIVGSSSAADTALAQAENSLEPITVTAKRQPDPIADEELTNRVATALNDDPYIYGEHFTVSVKNGVATVEGMVIDEWDLIQTLHLVRKITGVKRVINKLELMNLYYDDKAG